MSFKKIAYDVRDDIATIAFNDPKTMNAAGMDTIEELSLAIEQAGDEARCTIITGNGRGFCSGANLSANPGERPEGKPDAGKGLDTHYNPFIKAMRTHPHPIITAVNGAAAGVGCSIALMGDFIIAGESGYFLQAFRRAVKDRIVAFHDAGQQSNTTQKCANSRILPIGSFPRPIGDRHAFGQRNLFVSDSNEITFHH